MLFLAFGFALSSNTNSFKLLFFIQLNITKLDSTKISIFCLTIIFESSFSIQKKSMKELVQKGLEKIIVHQQSCTYYIFISMMIFNNYGSCFCPICFRQDNLHNWLENWREFRVMNLCKHVGMSAQIIKISHDDVLHLWIMFFSKTHLFASKQSNWLENWGWFRVMNLCKQFANVIDVRSIYKGGVKINHLISHDISLSE